MKARSGNDSLILRFVTAVVNGGVSAFPSLQRRGGRAIRKKPPFRKGAAGGVAHKSCCETRCETWPVSDHPVCALRWLRIILLMAQPPLLCKEGNPLRHQGTQDGRFY